MSAGPGGPLQERFESGLRFLAAALALEIDHRNGAAIVTAACDALRCFLAVVEAAAEARLEDRGGGIHTLRNQVEALLAVGQEPREAARHAVEAACLARDQAAALLPRLLSR